MFVERIVKVDFSFIENAVIIVTPSLFFFFDVNYWDFI